eukprot:scaffold19485_cov49-Phaeocystis_antarctica.AAC.1
MRRRAGRDDWRRWAGGNAGPPAGCFERLCTSTLPAGDLEMGCLQSKLFGDHCVNQLVRPTRIPPRQSGAAKA